MPGCPHFRPARSLGPLLHRHAHLGLLLSVLVFAVPAARAEEAGLCAHVAQLEPPASARSGVDTTRGAASCDGEAMLYGIGRRADPVQARLCSFAQRDASAERQEPSGLFDGDGLLMTIYANGWGVRRDLAIAAHFACSNVATAPAELEGRTHHLAYMAQHPSNAVFSPCDDITSGYSQAICAAHDSRVAQAKTKTALQAFTNGLSPALRPSFAALETAEETWAMERSLNEIDRGGSGGSAFQIAEADRQRADFLAMIERLRTGKPPLLGAQALQAAQERIDHVLPRLLAQPGSGYPGEVTPDKIRRGQVAWLAYRSAWGRFAALAYPDWGATGAQAWVSMKRADMLSRLLPSP